MLVVDDEPAICWAFERMLGDDGLRVLKASSAEEGLQLAAENQVEMVLLDVRLPKEDGISALPKFLAATHNAPVVIMTAFGDLDTAVAAVRNGASDYLTKPFQLEDAIRTCRSALGSGKRRAAAYAAPGRPSSDSQELIGRSPAMQQAFKQIALVAQSELSVLITGETGTGKELVAAAIHRHSQRSAAAYLPIAPVALNPELIESELFGHVKGAFTGASEDRAGLFERAEGGTILLDEIGDLPLGTQVKLLRVLEQGDYCRVGDVRPRRCNVRILAATNCDLQQAVREGRFREDLFYRLNGLHIRLPPLRERTEDLGLLCAYFLERIAYPGAAEAVGPEVLGALAGRAWPGNVRELKNAVEHAAIVARGRRLTIDDFPACNDASSLADAATVKTASGSRDRVTLEPSGAATVDPQLAASAAADAVERAVVAYLRELVERPGDDAPKLYDTLLAAVEPALFQFVLRHTGGNRIRAAEMLGIHRSTLRERLRHYRIDD